MQARGTHLHKQFSFFFFIHLAQIRFLAPNLGQFMCGSHTQSYLHGFVHFKSKIDNMQCKNFDLKFTVNYWLIMPGARGGSGGLNQ